MKKKKMNIADFKKMNNINLETEQMKKVFGGRVAAITLDTITCTPSGNSNDGDDGSDGE